MEYFSRSESLVACFLEKVGMDTLSFTPSIVLQSGPFPKMPVVEGCSPSMMAVREGLQTMDGLWALVNTMPRSASRSMWGVLAWECPKGPTQSFKSSIAINNISGRSLAWSSGEIIRAARTIRSLFGAISVKWRYGYRLSNHLSEDGYFNGPFRKGMEMARN